MKHRTAAVAILVLAACRGPGTWEAEDWYIHHFLYAGECTAWAEDDPVSVGPESDAAFTLGVASDALDCTWLDRFAFACDRADVEGGAAVDVDGTFSAGCGYTLDLNVSADGCTDTYKVFTEDPEAGPSCAGPTDEL